MGILKINCVKNCCWVPFRMVQKIGSSVTESQYTAYAPPANTIVLLRKITLHTYEIAYSLISPKAVNNRLTIFNGCYMSATFLITIEFSGGARTIVKFR